MVFLYQHFVKNVRVEILMEFLTGNTPIFISRLILISQVFQNDQILIFIWDGPWSPCVNFLNIFLFFAD